MQRQLILVALALFLNFASLAQTPTSPAWKRAQHLRHGINASEWFAQSRDYSPPRRDRIQQWQREQQFPICPSDDPDACNLYRDLKFPDGVYEHIEQYREAKARAEA